MGKLIISVTIFHSCVDLPEGKSHQIPLNHHFPMVFLYSFPEGRRQRPVTNRWKQDLRRFAEQGRGVEVSAHVFSAWLEGFWGVETSGHD